MKPTMNLRFVIKELYEPVSGYENVFETKKTKVLQQEFIDENNVKVWLDVPLETK